ncbi:MAG: hypothetical protein WBE09_04895 [Candidatus Acidiferrales bacterium]
MNQILGITLKIFRARRFAALALAASAALLLSASAANAGCGFPYKAGTAPSNAVVNPHVDDHQGGEDSNGPVSIVGLWHLIYTGTYSTAGPIPVPVIPPGPPSSFQFTESFKTWHADGTEFENAFLPPTGGDLCFGVWKDAGNGSVKLHHIGLMFDSSGDVSFIFTVDEIDTVARNGNSYKGDFTFKLWPPHFDEVGVGRPLQEITGTTAGTRITVD